MNKFRRLVREKLLINSINEKCIDPKRRELTKIIIDILATLNGVSLIGYRKVPMDPVQEFQLTNVDYIHKTKNRNDIYISMSEDIVDNIEIYVLIDEERITTGVLPVSKANTRRSLYSIPKLEYTSESTVKKIMEYDPNFHPTNDPRTQEDLIIKFNLYVPRLKNNVIILNGNHYFNKYYIEDAIQVTRAGKLKCQHPVYVSYLDITNDCFKLQIFGKTYNPLLFLSGVEMLDDNYINAILDVVKTPEKRDYYLKVIENTKDDLENYELTAEELDSLDNIYESIPASDILNYIGLYIRSKESDDNSSCISLHTSLKSKFLNDMKRALKMGGKRNARKQPPNELKAKINIDPRTVCTIIKNSNQYQLSKSANEVDSYNFFGYVSNIEDAENLYIDRKFTKDQLGIIDPIGSSNTSDNVGLSGILVFSIPDDKLKIEE